MVEIKTKLKGGFLEQPCRMGAMMDFDRVKQEKLAARREKYRNGEYSFADLASYLEGELEEMSVAWQLGNDPKALLRELADISNATDMMAFCMIKEGVR